MAVRLDPREWEAITLALLTRSGGVCEARTPGCLAGPDGRLCDRRDGRHVPTSRHHRQPRGAGGSALAGQHDLANLLLVCGDGVRGCHGHIEANRTWAYGRGLLVAHGDHPAVRPVTLGGGRRVLLDPGGGFYIEVPPGPL